MAQLAIQIRAFVHAKLFRRRRIVNRAPVGEQAVLQRGVVAGLAGDRQSPAQPGGGETDERQSPLPVKYFVRREQMAVRRQPALGNGCINPIPAHRTDIFFLAGSPLHAVVANQNASISGGRLQEFPEIEFHALPPEPDMALVPSATN